MRGIYTIKNMITGRTYVGSSVNVSKRLSQHRTDLRAGRHGNSRLQRSWCKHGEAAFLFEPLSEVGLKEDLLEAEREALSRFPVHYNLTPVGPAPDWTGRKHRPETVAKFRQFRHTPEMKEHLRQARTGKVMSEESRAKLRSYRTGRKSTPEEVEAMRKGLTGKRRTPEQIERYRASWTPERRAQQQTVRAKLRAEDVLKIRERYPAETILSLAEEYGVTDECIRCVVRRITWKNL